MVGSEIFATCTDNRRMTVNESCQSCYSLHFRKLCSLTAEVCLQMTSQTREFGLKSLVCLSYKDLVHLARPLHPTVSSAASFAQASCIFSLNWVKKQKNWLIFW